MIVHRLGVAAVMLAACGGQRDAVEDSVTVDTLPGGVVTTMSRGPSSGRWPLVLVTVQPGEGAPGELMSRATWHGDAECARWKEAGA